MSGQGIGPVVATGLNTKIGRISHALQTLEPERTRLQFETDRVVRTLAILGLALCVAVVVGYTLSRGGYMYRDSGEAERDYDGFPTLLCITTDGAAETQMAEAAFQVWYRRGGEPVPILLTNSQQIRDHPEGILAPIWRIPALAPRSKQIEREYWLP